MKWTTLTDSVSHELQHVWTRSRDTLQVGWTPRRRAMCGRKRGSGRTLRLWILYSIRCDIESEPGQLVNHGFITYSACRDSWYSFNEVWGASHWWRIGLAECFKDGFDKPHHKYLLEFVTHINLEHYPPVVAQTCIDYLSSVAKGKPEQYVVPRTTAVIVCGGQTL